VWQTRLTKIQNDLTTKKPDALCSNIGKGQTNNKLGNNSNVQIWRLGSVDLSEPSVNAFLTKLPLCLNQVSIASVTKGCWSISSQQRRRWNIN